MSRPLAMQAPLTDSLVIKPSDQRNHRSTRQHRRFLPSSPRWRRISPSTFTRSSLGPLLSSPPPPPPPRPWVALHFIHSPKFPGDDRGWLRAPHVQSLPPRGAKEAPYLIGPRPTPNVDDLRRFRYASPSTPMCVYDTKRFS